MTDNDDTDKTLKRRITLTAARMRELEADHELLIYADAFINDTWTQALCQDYGRKFGNGIGSTFMQADLKFCQTLEATVLHLLDMGQTCSPSRTKTAAC